MTQLGFNPEDFQAFQAARQEPQWVTAQRNDAWQQFSEQQWPPRPEEEWMRTDIRLFKLDKFLIPSEKNLEGLEAIEPLLSEGVELSGAVHSHNGICVTDTMDKELKQQGGIFGSLDARILEHG